MTMPRPVRTGLLALLLSGVTALAQSGPAQPAPAPDDTIAALQTDLKKTFKDRVVPFVTTYCVECHGNRRPTKGGVNFQPAFKDPGNPAFSKNWKLALVNV